MPRTDPKKTRIDIELDIRDDRAILSASLSESRSVELEPVLTARFGNFRRRSRNTAMHRATWKGPEARARWIDVEVSNLDVLL